MIRPCWSLLAGCVLIGATALGPLRADDAATDNAFPPEANATVTSNHYAEVTCTGTNIEVVSDVLQLAADSRDSLTPLLRLKSTWRYPVHITLVDPTPGSRLHESTSVLTDGKTLRIEAFLSSDDLNAREFVQRQFVTAMLWEKYFKPDATFTEKTRLDAVPLWLIEGLREWLNDDPDRNREAIVKRAAVAQRAPTLAEITSWKDLSDDRLLGLWQRAFSYYLVDSLVSTTTSSRRDNFQQWLASLTGANPLPPSWLFPTEAGWQHELLDSSTRSRGRFFTWDESVAELTAAETIALPKGKDDSDTRLYTIDTIAALPRSPDIARAVNRKVLELTALQLRVHPSWQPVLELYRYGLTTLVRDHNPARAAEVLHQARLRRAAEMDFRTKLTDYANWFEITQNMPIEASHFRTYFGVAQDIDKVEPDPTHPNPLRTDLLNVEAKF